MAKKNRRLQMQRRPTLNQELAEIDRMAERALAKERIDDKKTWWNGEPCQARIVRVIVGKSERSTWWCADMAGQEREVVEIHYGDFPLAYIDNEAFEEGQPGGSSAGAGWRKVTVGRGSPQYGHRSLPIERVLTPSNEVT